MKPVKAMFFIALTMATLSFSAASGQDKRAQALYVNSFIKFIKWPDQLDESKFVVAVLGEENEQFVKLFEKKKKKVGNLPLSLEFFTDLNEMKQCHILFVPEESNQQLDQVIDAFGVQSTLIVTCSPGYNKGAVINIDLENGMDLEIKSAEIRKRGMQISSSLIGLATEI